MKKTDLYDIILGQGCKILWVLVFEYWNSTQKFLVLQPHTYKLCHTAFICINYKMWKERVRPLQAFGREARVRDRIFAPLFYIVRTCSLVVRALASCPVGRSSAWFGCRPGRIKTLKIGTCFSLAKRSA